MLFIFIRKTYKSIGQASALDIEESFRPEKEIDATKTNSQSTNLENSNSSPETTSKQTLTELNVITDREPNIEDLLSSDTFPWHKLAKYGNPFINKTLRTIGNSLQKFYYFCFLLICYLVVTLT